MGSLYQQFVQALNEDDKAACVHMAMEAIEQKQVDVVTLYEQVLAPALNSIAGGGTPQSIAVWQEHIRTSIVETIMSCCYPAILSQVTSGGDAPRVLVFCPTDEYHEVGARMVSDYFTLCGYCVYYIGANTPASEFLGALEALGPKYVAMSITSMYNLQAGRSAIAQIRQAATKPVKVIVGGYAFSQNPHACSDIGADQLLHRFSDIEALAKEDGLL